MSRVQWAGCLVITIMLTHSVLQELTASVDAMQMKSPPLCDPPGAKHAARASPLCCPTREEWDLMPQAGLRC